MLIVVPFPTLQLCVQKLRILIEDSDQNCEPSVNACSVSFSHCLRVSGVVTPHPTRPIEGISVLTPRFPITRTNTTPPVPVWSDPACRKHITTCAQVKSSGTRSHKKFL